MSGQCKWCKMNCICSVRISHNIFIVPKIQYQPMLFFILKNTQTKTQTSKKNRSFEIFSGENIFYS